MDKRTLQQFLRRGGTWFRVEEVRDEFVSLATREHGEVGSEQPGREDIREGKRLVRILSEEFPAWHWEVTVVDEWTHVDGEKKASDEGEYSRAAPHQILKPMEKRFSELHFNPYGDSLSTKDMSDKPGSVSFRVVAKKGEEVTVRGSIATTQRDNYGIRKYDSEDSTVSTSDELAHFIKRILKKARRMKKSEKQPVRIGSGDPLHVKVAKKAYAETFGLKTARVKTAGEIRFVKDQGPEQREIPKDFEFDTKYIKPLSRVMWGLSCAMGHLVSSHSKFTKIKAVNVSPDGRLGGKGYIQPIQDMRKNISEAIETVSNCIDTIHDEIRAPHWKDEIESMPESEQEEVEETVQDAEDIISDPEGYAEKEYEEVEGSDTDGSDSGDSEDEAVDPEGEE